MTFDDLISEPYHYAKNVREIEIQHSKDGNFFEIICGFYDALSRWNVNYEENSICRLT